MAHACNPSAWEAETGELPQLQGLLGPHRFRSASLSTLSEKDKSKKRRKKMVSVGLRNEHVFGKKRKKKKKKMEKRVGGTLVPKPCSGKSKDLRDRDPWCD